MSYLYKFFGGCFIGLLIITVGSAFSGNWLAAGISAGFGLLAGAAAYACAGSTD